MGNAGSAGSSSSPPTEKKECLYEVLGVERTATPDEIRSAYRKEALRWHPDKAHLTSVSPEEAKKRFQAISNAYEVLSDPLERTWYDSHRSQILTETPSREEFELNLWSYFSPTAYSGYEETGKGFYAVYADVFSKIHLQEQMFSKKFGSGSVREAPSFGGSKSPHTEVSAFYDYWLGFKTVKDFAWCDEYDVTDAPSRKVRRVAEEENKKLRKRAQREYNDTVKQLAAFVKKRDKRVLERQAELQRIRQEKEMEQKRKQEELKKAKEKMVKEYQEPEWATLDEVEEIDDWDDSLKRGKNTNKQEFYCVCCEKRFRSEKQWENHERSKKHIERAAAMKDAFVEDDEMLESKIAADEQADSVVEQVEDAEHVSKVNSSEEQLTESESEIDTGAEEDEEANFAAMMNSRKARARLEDDDDISQEASVLENDTKRSKRKMNKEREASATRHTTEAEVAGLGSTMEELNVNDDGKQEVKQDKGKKSRRKGKKGEPNLPPEAMKKTANPPPETMKKAAGKGKKGKNTVPPSSICEVCGKDFDSRNMLFKHIESSKHFTLKR